jgi:MtN3 and saliva related transmembrane protein
MDGITILGLVAGTITTAAYVPQVIKTFKTKNTKALSAKMYSFLVFGILLWVIYGFITHNWPVLIANSITAVLASSILLLKIKYG